MDFTFVTEDQPTKAAMFATFEGDTADVTDEIHQLIESQLEVGSVIEIDWDILTVFVDADYGAADCDACGNYRFIAAVNNVELGDGSIDDTFKFCQDCVDAKDDDQIDRFNEYNERLEMERIERGL